jgi:hypothetical protein
VAARRPVLLRKALRGKSWDALRSRWSRANVAKAHTDVKFNTSTIPYARQFDETAEEVEMDLVQYIAYMSELAGADDANAEPPQYIFSSLSAAMSTDSTLHETILHMDPPFVDWNKMLKNSPQFYLGPPGTGAPVHFHTHAYNVLIHGRKKWAL